MSDTEHVTYGGIQDRPEDVNHPSQLGETSASTDPNAGTATENAGENRDYFNLSDIQN